MAVSQRNLFTKKKTVYYSDAVQVLVEHGHNIILEAGAGEGSFFTVYSFSKRSLVTTSQAEVYGQDLVLKINPTEEMDF